MRGCGHLDLTPSFVSGFLEISYNLQSLFPTLQLSILHFPQGRWYSEHHMVSGVMQGSACLYSREGFAVSARRCRHKLGLLPARCWHVVKPLPCLSHSNSACGHGLIWMDEWGCFIHGTQDGDKGFHSTLKEFILIADILYKPMALILQGYVLSNVCT